MSWLGQGFSSAFEWLPWLPQFCASQCAWPSILAILSLLPSLCYHLTRAAFTWPPSGLSSRLQPLSSKWWLIVAELQHMLSSIPACGSLLSCLRRIHSTNVVLLTPPYVSVLLQAYWVSSVPPLAVLCRCCRSIQWALPFCGLVKSCDQLYVTGFSL